MDELDKAGRALAKARGIMETAMYTAQLAAINAASEGVAETEIARSLGVNRMTVRKWLGKL